MSTEILDTVPFRVTTKAEAVYQELRARILDGSFEPASTLNQEALAASLGLSITPLREALRRLEAEGFVLLKAHRTITIAPLTRRELNELYAVRLHLDPIAASLAAQNATDAQLDEIQRLAEQPPPTTPRTALEANRAFHRAVYSASGNLVLTQIVDQLWNRTDRYRLIVVRDRIHLRTAGKEHREIAAALKAREADRVAGLVSYHVETTHRLILQLADGL